MGWISFVKILVQVLAAIVWARWMEKKRRYKIFIVMSFLISSLVVFPLYFGIFSVGVLSLSALLSAFYVAHIRAESVLLVESFPSSEWTGGVAGHNLLVGLSGVVGLLVATLWTTRWDIRRLMLLCSFLVLVSMFLSVFLIRDPVLIIEKKIVRWEKFVHLVDVASSLIYAPVSYAPAAEKRYLTRGSPSKTSHSMSFFVPSSIHPGFYVHPHLPLRKYGCLFFADFLIHLFQSVTTLIGYTFLKVYNQKILKTIKVTSVLGIFFPTLILISVFIPFSLSLISLALAISGFA